MRFSSTPTSLTAPTQPRQIQISANYRGNTTNATATELFIDGQPTRRLVPDNSSGGLLVLRATQYTPASNTVRYVNLYVSYAVSAAGVITLVDQDSGTAGSQDNVVIGVQAITTRAGQLGVGVGADHSLAVDAVPASGGLPAYIRLQVRGAAATTAIWEVQIEALEATAVGG